MEFQQAIPVLRIFDEGKAAEFYIEFLEFHIDWQHKFEDDLPLYMQVSKGDCILHLSEHHGDCAPGSYARIPTKNIKTFHGKLKAKKYKNARSGLETTPWKTLEITLKDPFHNTLVFYEDKD